MRRLGLVAIILLPLIGPIPAHAQADDPDPQTGPSISDQFETMMRDLLGRIKPAWDEAIGPFDIFNDIDDIENYDQPEILPNGDILIPRRKDAPPYVPPEAAPTPPDPGDGGPPTDGAGIRT